MNSIITENGFWNDENLVLFPEMDSWHKIIESHTILSL